MVLFTAKAEILTKFHNEQVEIGARTVNGTNLPARKWWKRYYHAIVNDTPCMLRFREEVPVQADLVRGALVEVTFAKVEVENDVSQIHCTSLNLIKK